MPDRSRLGHRDRFVICICASLLGVACAGAVTPPGAAPQSTPPPVTADAASIERARADSARIPYTGADVRFFSMMIPHHAQAIVMSEMAPSHGASESVRTLAARIINAQRDEIAIMQQWLLDRRQPVPDPALPDAHAAHGMPGMLTAAELAALDAARGAAFDKRFLRSMISHHEGAVTMVTQLFATDGAGQNPTVFKIAADINVDQRTEIARMQRMLAPLLFAESEP